MPGLPEVGTIPAPILQERKLSLVAGIEPVQDHTGRKTAGPPACVMMKAMLLVCFCFHCSRLTWARSYPPSLVSQAHPSKEALIGQPPETIELLSWVWFFFFQFPDFMSSSSEWNCLFMSSWRGSITENQISLQPAIITELKSPTKNPHAMQETQEFDPWIRKIPWRRKWQPTPVFLPGKFHGQRNLAGYSPWGHKALDMTDAAQHTQGGSPNPRLVGMHSTFSGAERFLPPPHPFLLLLFP